MLKRIVYIFVVLLLSLLQSGQLFAQCTTAKLNWDNLEYLTTSGNYAGYVTTAMTQTQSFAIGRTKLTIATGANFTISGDDITHTGETGSYGTGADVQFTSLSNAVSFTITFDEDVSNIQFSLYDIDKSQWLNVSGVNAASVAQTVILSLANGASATVLSSNPGTNPLAKPGATDYALTDNKGTVNVDIAGPVKTVTISFSNAKGNFWLSDIAACVSGSFPTSYYAVSRPFTGSPGYVLAAVNSSVYQVNPANGAAKVLFTDPSGNDINSMGYDPYNRILYYTYDLTSSPSTDKSVYKYNFKTGTISTFISDVSTLGIPIFESGVERAGGAFYNGSYYLGIEANSGSFAGRKSIVWQIDLDVSLNPVSARQVYGMAVDDGSGNLIHDWSDFAISNGILFDFDGATSDKDVYQLNMQTGVNTDYAPTFTPKQVAVGWDEKIYDVDGFIVPYNNTTGITVAQQYTITSAPAIPSGTWLDAAEAYRPNYDFGDAPASYDPDPWSPALHDQDSTLRLGATFDREWNKTSSVLADADGADEDGLAYAPILAKSLVYYAATLSVYNHTGSNATVCAWLDYNANGVFDSGEGISVTVASKTTQQNVSLYWPFTPTSIPANSYTYLRIRITSASNGMGVSNPTGYYSNGEVEDYRVLVDNNPLPVRLISFDAEKTPDQNVKLSWKLNDELPGTTHHLQRSIDGQDWVTIHQQTTLNNNPASYIEYIDEHPVNNTSFYRLELVPADGRPIYSTVRKIIFDKNPMGIKLIPNPALDHVTVDFKANDKGNGKIHVADASGKIVHQQNLQLERGTNSITLPFVQRLPSGTYWLQLQLDDKVYTERLVIDKR